MKRKRTTTEIICENLGLPYQTIFQDYKCTLRSNFSYFGRLYMGEEHLMFVSNMFGFIKKVAINIESITRLTELPDGFSLSSRAGVNQPEQEFIFTGFKNNYSFKIIRALWNKERISSQVLKASEEEDDLPAGKSFIEEADKEKERLAAKIRALDQASVEINMFNPLIVDAEKQKMLELVIPCSVEQFFTFFLADDAEVYPRRKHLELKKATRIVTTPWKRNDQLGAEVRQINALLKVKGVPFKSEAGMSQVCMLSKNERNELSLKVITQMADVPFSSHFTCEEHISVTRQGDTKCKYQCSTAVVFNKGTYMKNTILSRTFEDLQEDYKMWSDNVKERLQRMKKQQEEAAASKQKAPLDVEFEHQKSTDSETQLPPPPPLAPALLAPLQNSLQQLKRIGLILVVLVALNLVLTAYQIWTGPKGADL